MMIDLINKNFHVTRRNSLSKETIFFWHAQLRKHCACGFLLQLLAGQITDVRGISLPAQRFISMSSLKIENLGKNLAEKKG